MLNFYKKKITYLPKLKLMGRSAENKYIFKDGLLKVAFKNISFKKVHLGENFSVKIKIVE